MSSNITDNYEKKTQLEHILDRPAMYIGSVENVEEEIYIFDNEHNKIIKKKILMNHGLQRIYEEILLNAFDQTVRTNTNIKNIKVNIDKETNTISIQNDGKGIPILKKEEYDLWIPEMIFGHLFTSSNYNKNTKRIVGGQNGLGAKLTNIFSKLFILETIDSDTKKSFKISWENNFNKSCEPEIKPCRKKSITTITFQPDLDKFGITNLSDDMINLFKKRVYDIAANTHKNISVYYNDEKIQISRFEDYIKLYLPDDCDRKIVVDEDMNNRWSVGLVLNDGFEAVSFVNGINTNLNGTHVDHVVKNISNEFIKKLEKKKVDVKNSYIKDNMFIFVKSFIENPEFNSQTKEILKTKPSSFGSKFEMNDKFIKNIMKTGILENVLSFSKFKETQSLNKNNGSKKRKVRIPNLDDAKYAGTVKSDKCKLFLTEGLSASTYAIAGLSKIGKDYYGVFSLKGKLLNVREQSPTKINNNDEISNIKEIIGLKHNHKYTSLTELRYGGIIILTDADVDGYHIKSLIVNMIHTFWPELIDLGFICSFSTNIVRATKRNEIKEFFTLSEFNQWKDNLSDTEVNSWSIKYFKGLGTSTAKEAKASFNNFNNKLITYTQSENTDKDINLGFNKKLANDRKDWLLNYDKDEIITQKEKIVSISDMIHKELKHFSYYDIYRSIPSLIDGMKPTQRKIIYTGMKYISNNTKEIKVAQFGAKVAEKTCYHHGEKSIFDTIINMAQNYVGANNMNLLLPNGNFGTRNYGGSDHASERYIFTNIHPITYKLFKRDDENLLNYKVEEGQNIEPEWYLPILPNILINGTVGIGTGFSTTVLQYNVNDIANYIISKLNDKKCKKIKPYYRFFDGNIIKEKGQNKYKVYGNFELKDKDCSMIITELPIGIWTKKYKEFLESLIFDKTVDKKKQSEQCIKDVEDTYSSTVSVYFKIYFEKEYYNKLKNKTDEFIYKKFKLMSSLSENNMYLFDENNQIQKYDNITDILDYFYKFRLGWYQKRKDYILNKLEKEMNILHNKEKFIRYVYNKKLIIIKVSDEHLNKQLEDNKFDKIIDNDGNANYNYLIDMKIKTLTIENANKLTNEFKNKQTEFNTLKNTNIKDIWKTDIDELLVVYNKYNKLLEKEINELKYEKK